MAIDREQLQNDIEALIAEARLSNSTQDDQQSAFKLSTAIHNYVTQGEINYQGGLTAPNGAVTGSINGNIN